jgi:hypothetical protein
MSLKIIMKHRNKAVDTFPNTFTLVDDQKIHLFVTALVVNIENITRTTFEISCCSFAEDYWETYNSEQNRR